MKRTGYTVRNAEIEAKLREKGRMITQDLPEGFGFMLFLFSFGEGGVNFYISNAQREDMIEAMKEWIERQEGESTP